MSTRQLLPLLCFTLGVLAAPSSASAGSYAVPVCGSAAGGVNHSWSYGSTAPGVLESGSTCPADGSEYSGLWVRDILASGVNFDDGQAGDWVITAPTGLSISAITYNRWLYKQGDNDLQPSLRTAEGTILDGCTLGSPTFMCSAGSTGGGGSATFTGLSTASLRFGVRCATGGGGVLCSTGGTIHHVRAALYDGVVTITDNGGPSLGATSGPLLAGGWLRGTLTVGTSATDASGISRERVLLTDGPAQEIGTLAIACDYTYPKPCPDQGNAPAVSVATGALPDGSHQMQLTAQDAAGNESISAPATVLTDNTAPGAPNGLSIAEGTTTAGTSLHVSWTNPSGQAAPITGAHWSICPQTGGSCQTGDSTGDSASLPATEGMQRVRVWLQDQAGNTNPASAATADVTVDRTAPTAPLSLTSTVASGANAQGARQVTTAWTNPPGQISPITSAHWSVCPASGGTCTAGDIPNSPLVVTLAPGSFVIRVWLQDQAGNTNPATAASGSLVVPAPNGGSGGPPAARRANGLRVTRTLHRHRLTVGAMITSAATGSVKLTVTARRDTKVLLHRTRTVRIARGRVRFTLIVPWRARSITTTAVYAGSKLVKPGRASRVLYLHR